MMYSRLSTFALAASALLGAALTTSADADAATRLRFRCSATGAVDISMAARYDLASILPAARRKFTTEFEAGPGTGFLAGGTLALNVKGVNVGTMTLEPLLGGGVTGDVNFDTRPQLDAQPFPANWPANVGRGTVVSLLRGTTPVLGCTLR